ncbi:MAG: 4a-hydroxytetrahydrobiopterin dehydratase [Balneolaceae bacterium]|nr:4a-hydroxytetrahydrobiopterin dehydratase [Balneolaceae bacterium]
MPAEALPNDELTQQLKTLPEWTFDDNALTRTFTVGDFREAMQLILAIGFEAEALQHHPELTNVYNRVSIRLTTHDAGDKVTTLDIALAQAIDALVVPNE